MENWYEYLEILKVVNCIDRPEMEEVLGVKNWRNKEEMDDIWKMFSTSVFHGLCVLDTENLNRLMEYAKDKMQKEEIK